MSNPKKNDKAHLLVHGPDRSTVATYGGHGFLNWDPGQQDNPPGESDAARLTSAFADLIKGVGENGCGFEAPLEAWHRFWWTRPRTSAWSKPTDGCREPEGVDDELLTQRQMYCAPTRPWRL